MRFGVLVAVSKAHPCELLPCSRVGVHSDLAPSAHSRRKCCAVVRPTACFSSVGPYCIRAVFGGPTPIVGEFYILVSVGSVQRV